MLYSDGMVTFFIPLTISKSVLCKIANNLITIVIEKKKKSNHSKFSCIHNECVSFRRIMFKMKGLFLELRFILYFKDFIRQREEKIFI